MGISLWNYEVNLLIFKVYSGWITGISWNNLFLFNLRCINYLTLTSVNIHFIIYTNGQVLILYFFIEVNYLLQNTECRKIATAFLTSNLKSSLISVLTKFIHLKLRNNYLFYVLLVSQCLNFNISKLILYFYNLVSFSAFTL